jgi:hypothetical protein
MYQLNKEALKKAIRNAYVGGNQGLIENMILGMMENRYRISDIEATLDYIEGELHFRKFLSLNKKDDFDALYHLVMKTSGRTTHTTTFCDEIPEDEQDYFDWYLHKHDDTNYFGPIGDPLGAKRLLKYLAYYWDNTREYIFHSCEKVNEHLYKIKLSIKGMEGVILEICYLANQRKVSTVHMNSLEFRNLDRLFDNDEIVEYITKEAPCRLELLYEKYDENQIILFDKVEVWFEKNQYVDKGTVTDILSTRSEVDSYFTNDHPMLQNLYDIINRGEKLYMVNFENGRVGGFSKEELVKFEKAYK